MNQSFPSLGSLSAGGDRSRGPSDAASLFNILWRGKWGIGLCLAVGVLIGGYYAYRVATPMYRSASVVMLEARQEQVVDLQSVMSGLSADAATINSEVEVLRSRSLMGRVVDELDLMSDPEFNGSLRAPSGRARFQSWLGGLFRSGASETPAAAPDPARVRDAVIGAALNHISIRNVPNSLVFQISAQSVSAEKAAALADAVARHYVNDQLEEKFAATEQATFWLTNRVTTLQGELETAEARLQEFRASTQLISPETLSGLERQIKDLRSRIDATREQQASLQDKVTRLQAAQTPQEQAEVAQDIQLNRLLPRIDEPSIAQDFDNRVQQILRQAQIDLTRQANQIQSLENSSVELASSLEDQSSDLIEQQQLSREAEASRLLYEYFLTRLKETSAQQGVQQADSRILSNAVVPGGPYEPRKSMILLLSAFLGGLVGAALMLLREMGKNTFRTARQMEQVTGTSVMGQIPLLPAKRRVDVLSYLADKPASAPAEAIRNLRTSILLSNVDNPPKVIGVTSCVPGEGKTTMSLALAQNFSSMGKRTLLIEGDIRRRTFGQYFGVPKNQKGVVSVLSKEATLEEALFHDDRIGADLLLGERSKINAADLFASDRFAAFLQEMRARYDIILIDTAPVLVVPDARVIASNTDTMLFTVAWDRTTQSQVTEALHMFELSGQRVKGLILNQISAKGMKRYGYGGKYGSYGAYASYGKKYYTE